MSAIVPPEQDWRPLPDDPSSFYDHAEHVRLVALGLVPELVTATGPSVAIRGSASGRALNGRSTMSAATAEKPATAKKPKSAIAGLSKAKLRAYLLSHVTVPDTVWNADYGAPEREKGETREAFIRRVLG